MKPAIEILFSDEQHDVVVECGVLRRLAGAVLAERGVPENSELSITLVDEESIAALNATYRGKEGPTDVLSFGIDDPAPDTGSGDGAGPAGTAAPGAPRMLGDIVICPAVAQRNATEHAVTPAEEVALLVVHGILHLLGMDHEVDSEAEEMEALERTLLAALLPGASRGSADEDRSGVAVT